MRGRAPTVLGQLGLVHVAAAVAAGAARAPSAVERSAVEWFDADWPAELGSMPLGNGDVSANGALSILRVLL